MQKKQAFFALLVLTVLVSAVRPAAAYGETASGLPLYQERTFASLVNAARVGPSGYRTTYMTGYNTTGILTTAAQAPLYIDPKLSITAHNHSTDLTVCHAIQFNSCSGTAWSTRVLATYTCPSGAIGENLQAEYSNDPVGAINDGLCSWAESSSGTYYCCPDGASCAGSRQMYLSVSYSRIGVGEASDSATGYTYWTTDLGSCDTLTYTNLIASGSHIIQSGKTRFFATYWDPLGAPKSAQVFINGVASSLAVDTGVAGKGNYFALLASGTTCRSYYFQFTSTSGGVYRYPETGYFNTYGEGSCVTDWTATAAGNSTATVPGVPQSVAVASITSTSAVISWSAPATTGGSAVTGYSVSATASGQTLSWTTSSTSVSATGFTSGTSYTVTVSASNSVGSGPASAGKSFITLATSASPSPSPSGSPAASSPSTSPSGSPAAKSPSPSPSKGASASPSPSHSPAAASHSPSPSPSASPQSNAACTTASCLPTSYNFHTQTACNVGIMDQQQCGSCYAFSTAAANSDRFCYAQGLNVVLSPQEILNCGSGTVWTGANACDGGDPYQAALLLKSKGFPTSNTVALTTGCLPYTCASGTCPSSSTCSANCQNGTVATVYKGTGATQVSGVTNAMLEIYNNGPITVAYSVCQSFYDFFDDASNVGSVYTTDCTSSSSDYMGGHAVSAVGWGTDSNGVNFWLIANSWAASWGDSGYFRIQRGTDLCGIEDYITAATIARTNKRFGGMSMVERDSSSALTGVPVPLNPSNGYALRSSQLVLDLWYLSNYGANDQSINTTQLAGRKRAAAPAPALSTYPTYSVSGINTATVQVTAGQNVFVDFVASDGVNTVNLASTVSFGTSGGVAAVAPATIGTTTTSRLPTLRILVSL